MAGDREGDKLCPILLHGWISSKKDKSTLNDQEAWMLCRCYEHCRWYDEVREDCRLIDAIANKQVGNYKG
jgi:hypothetical protein